IKAKGMAVFARIDHAAGAAQAGLSLRPTEVLIFGNAKAGTPLMQSNQTLGIDPPLEALVWHDAGGKVWLAYYGASWVRQRPRTGGRNPSDGRRYGERPRQSRERGRQQAVTRDSWVARFAGKQAYEHRIPSVQSRSAQPHLDANPVDRPHRAGLGRRHSFART